MTDPQPAHAHTPSAVDSCEPGPAPGAPRASGRRLLRWAIVLFAMVVGVVVCWHDNAYAHDGVVLTVHTDGQGSVWADVAWEDGHPVSESISAAITAHSQAGTRVGPIAMTALPGLGSVRYSGTLAAGRWRVVVDAAEPGTGTCTADFEIGKQASPQTVKCDRPPAYVAEPTPAKSGSGSRTLTFVAIAAGILVIAGVAMLMARQRTTS
jgi:hypothetical protein